MTKPAAKSTAKPQNNSKQKKESSKKPKYTTVSLVSSDENDFEPEARPTTKRKRSGRAIESDDSDEESVRHLLIIFNRCFLMSRPAQTPVVVAKAKAAPKSAAGTSSAAKEQVASGKRVKEIDPSAFFGEEAKSAQVKKSTLAAEDNDDFVPLISDSDDDDADFEAAVGDDGDDDEEYDEEPPAKKQSPKPKSRIRRAAAADAPSPAPSKSKPSATKAAATKAEAKKPAPSPKKSPVKASKSSGGDAAKPKPAGRAAWFASKGKGGGGGGLPPKHGQKPLPQVRLHPQAKIFHITVSYEPAGDWSRLGLIGA